MEKIIINKLNLDKDLKEIMDWENRYAGTEGLENIKRFILEGDAYYNLAEVIDVNYEKFAISGDERKFALAIRDTQNNLLGFTLNAVIDVDTMNPELLIQYLVINPEYQSKGIGKKALLMLLGNTEEYYGMEINKAFARIDISNISSRKLFESVGFELNYTNSKFLSATIDENTNIKE